MAASLGTPATLTVRRFCWSGERLVSVRISLKAGQCNYFRKILPLLYQPQHGLNRGLRMCQFQKWVEDLDNVYCPPSKADRNKGKFPLSVLCLLNSINAEVQIFAVRQEDFLAQSLRHANSLVELFDLTYSCHGILSQESKKT